MNVEIAGVRVHVGTGGANWREGEPPMVLLHGAGMDHTVWVLLARYFARRGFSVVAPDLPGHGRSGGTAPESVDAQADWLWALLDQLRSTHGLSAAAPVLVGHSMGSLATLEATARRPADVTHLLLLGCAWPMPVSDVLLDAARNDTGRAADMITEFGHAYASQLGHNPVPGLRVTTLANVLLRRAAAGVLANDLAACDAYAGGDAAASSIAAAGLPVTMIAGSDDRMTPLRAAKAFAATLQARLSVIDGCGHMLMTEQPEATLAAMRTALA